MIARNRPNFNADGASSAPDGGNRASSYGDAYGLSLLSAQQNVADEGSYFLVRSPTSGTGVATTATPTAESFTAPFLFLYNGNADRRVFLDYLILTCTAAGTAGTSVSVSQQLDTTNLYSSGGVAATPVNINMNSPISSGVTFYHGTTLTLSAATAAARLVSHRRVKTAAAPAPVIADIYSFTFNGFEGSSVGNDTTNSNSVPAHMAFNCHPIVLGPNDCWKLSLWLPSQSAASSFEYELGFAVR